MRKILAALTFTALTALPATAATVLGDGDHTRISNGSFRGVMQVQENGYLFSSDVSGEGIASIGRGSTSRTHFVKRLDHGRFNVIDVHLTTISNLYFYNVLAPQHGLHVQAVRDGKVVYDYIFKDAGTVEQVWTAPKEFRDLDALVFNWMGDPGLGWDPILDRDFDPELVYQGHVCYRFCYKSMIHSMTVASAAEGAVPASADAAPAPVPLPAAVLPFGMALAGLGLTAHKRRKKSA